MLLRLGLWLSENFESVAAVTAGPVLLFLQELFGCSGELLGVVTAMPFPPLKQGFTAVTLTPVNAPHHEHCCRNQ